MNFLVLLKWISPVFIFISFFAKRNKNKYVFGEWLGMTYSDSSKFIFEFALTDKSKQVIWITKSKDVFNKLRSENKPVFYAYSIKGIYHQITSKYFICTVSSRDINCFTCFFSAKIIMLGHGLPIKEQSHKFTSFEKLKRYIRFRTIDRYYKSASESEFFDDIAHRQYHLDRSDIIRIPAARCDIYNQKMDIYQQNNFLSRNEIIADDFNIIYLPTHRNEGENATVILMVIDQLNSLADVINKKYHCSIKFHVKLHQYDSALIKKISYKNVNMLEFSTKLSNLFQVADAFMGDYSGIFYDFIYFKKPMIAYVPDYDDYICSSRKLYTNLEELYGAVAYSRDELTIILEKIMQDHSSKNNLFLPKYERTLSETDSFSKECWESIKEC